MYLFFRFVKFYVRVDLLPNSSVKVFRTTRIKYYSITITVTMSLQERFEFIDHRLFIAGFAGVSFGKRVGLGKKEIICRLAPLSGLSLALFFSVYREARKEGDPGQWMRKKKLNRSRGASGRRHSRCVIDRNGIIGVRFLRWQQYERRSLRGARENAGNACCCFLFVFPSSEVIDESPS